MENLNSEQKIFIKTFVDSWMKNKITLTIGQMESSDFQIDKKNDKYYFLTNTKNTEPVAVLFDAIYILRSLEENNFLYFSKIKRTPPPYEHQEKKYALEIIDENLIEYLDKKFDKSIIITQALINFVSNNFKTGEQIKFERQLKIAKNSFYLSFVGLLIAIIIPFCGNTSFNQKQLDEIKQSIEALKIDTPIKINTVITNDTLKVDNVNFQHNKSIIKKK